jgi:putative transcriptional regulator
VAQQPFSSNSPIRLAGKLLLADPALNDGIFNRSVILLTDHSSEEGAFGLILNHPADRVVGDFLEDEAFSPLRKLAVHDGGPVLRDQLTFSAFWWNNDRLRWAVRISAAEAIKHSQRPGTLVRAFIGYSGWSAGQLESELRRNTWTPVNPDPGLLGETHDLPLWRTLMRKMSPLHHILAEAPMNPLFN